MPRFKTNKGHAPKLYTFRGITGTLKEIHAAFPWPMGLSALRWRLRQGMSLETAYQTPAYDWQRKHADLAIKKLEWSRQGLLPKPPKSRKPAHPADVLTAHCGVCTTCGAVLLKQSLENGHCKGGC